MTGTGALSRRVDRLEKQDRVRDEQGEIVGVVVMDGQDEEQKISEELRRRGLRRGQARIGIFRVPATAPSMEAWGERYRDIPAEP